MPYIMSRGEARLDLRGNRGRSTARRSSISCSGRSSSTARITRRTRCRARVLLNIKSGGCPEDCAYCPQSAHYKTGVARTELVERRRGARGRARGARPGRDAVLHGRRVARRAARAAVRSRPRDGARRARARHGSVLHARHARHRSRPTALAGAGLTAYNHNLDTSPEFYGQIITTRTYDDRLATLARVRAAGITVCCGGIIGMGESRDGALRAAAAAGGARSASGERADQHARARGRGRRSPTRPPEDPLDLVRMIATARILMPRSLVRLSAGRLSLSDEAQALCFLAGANSVFLGDRAADDAESDGGCRPRAVRQARHRCGSAGNAVEARMSLAARVDADALMTALERADCCRTLRRSSRHRSVVERLPGSRARIRG